MEHLIDPESFVGKRVIVTPKDNDDFCQEFVGDAIGVKKGFLKVRDADDDVFMVEVSQVTIEG